MAKAAVTVNSLGKRFYIDHEKLTFLKSFNLKQRREFWALKDVSFDIEQGSIVGLAGENGAGKSTLLKILSGITKQTEGNYKIEGRVASLLELGTGFHPDLSGKDNIFFNGALMGMDRDYIKSRYEQIVEFSGIKKFIDTPVKHYSTGMYLRLGFAVAIFLEADILIIDEVLSVGDWRFQRKCMDMIWKYSREGKTIIIVSHDKGLLNSICDRVLYLKNGKLSVIEKESFNALLKVEQEKRVENDSKNPNARQGTGTIRLDDVWIEDKNGERLDAVYSGQDIEICFSCDCLQEQDDIILSFSVHDQKGRSLFRCDSQANALTYSSKKGCFVFRCSIDRLPLSKGLYSLSFHAYSLEEDIDLYESCMSLEVHHSDFWGTKYIDNHSPFLLDHSWQQEIEQGDRLG